MNSPSPLSAPPRRRGRKIVIAIAVLVLLLVGYTLCGFLLAPWLAKRELPRHIEATLAHRMRIGEVEFNPFTLRLRADDLALDDSKGAAVLGFAHATVVLDWRSLFRRAWLFTEVRVVDPSVNIEIAKDGRLNLAALLPKESSDGPVRVAVGRLTVENGRVKFEDKRAGYHTLFERMSIELSALSTLAADKGPYSLVGQTSSGAKVRWKGEASQRARSTSARTG